MAPRSTISKLALVCLASSFVPSASALTVAIAAAQALGILEGRQSSTCANPNFSRCADTKLPSDFCCPSDSTCISLDSSSTALCCPKGADCSRIEPISCDLAFQDVSERPDAAIKTTRLNDKLVTCGSETCCPFGYSCSNNSQCVLDKATRSKEGSSSSSSLPSSTSSSPSPSTTTLTGIGSTTPAASGTTPLCPRFPGAAVAVGFFPGMLVGALVAAISVICLGRHKAQVDRPYSKGSGWSSIKYSNSYNRGRGANGTITGISDPIPLSQAPRSDFLRRQPSAMLRKGAYRAKSWFSTKSSPSFGDISEKTSPLNPMNHWKMPTQPVPNNIPLTVVRTINPVTPPSQIRPSAASLAREPSTESIKIYSPPSMVRLPSRSGFSPPSQRQSQHGLKPTIIEKLSPFKGTELKAKSITASPPSHPSMNAERNADANVNSGPNALTAGGALDPGPKLPPSSHNATTLANSTNPQADTLNNNTNSFLAPTKYQPHPKSKTNIVNSNNSSSRLIPSESASLTLPNNTRPLTHMTTFTDVLRDAGLEPGDAETPAAPTPQMPAIPRGLDWNGGSKKKKKAKRPQ